MQFRNISKIENCFSSSAEKSHFPNYVIALVYTTLVVKPITLPGLSDLLLLNQ